MSINIKFLYLFLASLVFIALPIIFFFLGEFPQRTILKNSLSIITIIAFFVIIGQFYLSKINEEITKVFKTFKVKKVHKTVGYLFLPILIIHPFLIVVPRFFEVGPSPIESFIKMITSFDSLGIILGLTAWVLMFILGFTSVFKDNLNMTYKNWKILHGVLSLGFIILASWHTIDMGRHMSNWMIALIVILTAIASILLSKTYIFTKKEAKKEIA